MFHRTPNGGYEVSCRRYQPRSLEQAGGRGRPARDAAEAGDVTGATYGIGRMMSLESAGLPSIFPLVGRIAEHPRSLPRHAGIPSRIPTPHHSMARSLALYLVRQTLHRNASVESESHDGRPLASA